MGVGVGGGGNYLRQPNDDQYCKGENACADTQKPNLFCQFVQTFLQRRGRRHFILQLNHNFAVSRVNANIQHQHAASSMLHFRATQQVWAALVALDFLGFAGHGTFIDTDTRALEE